MRNRCSRVKSLQVQLLSRLFLVLVILLVSLGLYQFVNMKEYLYESKVEYLDSRFKNLDKEVIVKTNTEEQLKKNAYYILNEISVENVCAVIIDNNGRQVAAKNIYTGIPTDISKDNGNVMDIPKFSETDYLKMLNKRGMSEGYSTCKDKNGKTQIVIWREIGSISNPIGLVQISTYIDSANRILSEQIKMYALSAIAILIIGSALVLAVLKSTLKPLKIMTDKLDEIDTDALDKRLNENTGQIEIDKLANRFNRMFERLETAFLKEKNTNEKMKNFILDASHELRTPLTSIQGFVEVLQMGAAKNEQQLQIALNSILEESQRLSKLVNNLLLLTKIEDNPSVEMYREDVSSIIKEIIPQLEMLKGNRKLEVNLKPNTYCKVNRDEIKQVIYNLVQNSINHTSEEKGEIFIITDEVEKNDERYLEITIKDNGEGIPEGNLKLIFDRFYRGDGHRSRKKGGYGLGLSIVDSLIKKHQGHIDVESKLNEGTIFKVYLKISL